MESVSEYKKSCVYAQLFLLALYGVRDGAVREICSIKCA